MNILFASAVVLLLSLSVVYGNNETHGELSPRYASTCYYCAACPSPFYYDTRYVSTVYTPTGWCAKKSLSSSKYAAASRGAADPGLCYYNGCRWTYVNGVYTWVCCCDRYLCNKATPTMKTTSAVLAFGLIVSMIMKKSN